MSLAPARLASYACLALTLAACDASQPVRPVVSEVRTVTVTQPVKVPCIDPADVPPKTPTAMPDPETADIGQLAAGAKADGIALRSENEQLRASLIACTKLQPQTGDKQ